MKRPNDKILIIGPSWIGDLVMAQCLFKLIKQNQPNTQLDVLAQNFLHPILKRMPEITKTISLNINHGELALWKRYKLGKQLTKQNYTQAIVLPNSFKSALIPFFAKIPKRTGWRGEWRYGILNDLHVLNKKQHPLMIERFMQLGLEKNTKLTKPYPAPHLEISKTNLEQVKQKFNTVSAQQPILGICPGAEYGPAKRWPTENFAKVANNLLKKGWQIWLFGSKKEKPIALQIQQLTKNLCSDFTGQTDLGDAIDLLAQTKAIISNDSGLMHITAALHIPLIAIYGSSSPEFTPPLNQEVSILTSKLACSPCFKRTCKYGHYKCLHDVTPELVMEELCKY